MKLAPETASLPGATSGRPAVRRRLLAERDAFVASTAFAAAHAELSLHLCAVLARLEPACLGLYSAMRSEFNAAAAVAADPEFDKTALALPFARRGERAMEYRRWNGAIPSRVDECGIATADGEPVQPDVVVVPCLGFTATGQRLGYGGGYYDRWLAANGHVVAVGVAWSFAEVDDALFAAQAHDIPLALVVTEQGVR